MHSTTNKHCKYFFTGLKNKRQPEEISEESGLLEIELNGEIHITSVLGYLTKLR